MVIAQAGAEPAPAVAPRPKRARTGAAAAAAAAPASEDSEEDSDTGSEASDDNEDNEADDNGSEGGEDGDGGGQAQAARVRAADREYREMTYSCITAMPWLAAEWQSAVNKKGGIRSDAVLAVYNKMLDAIDLSIEAATESGDDVGARKLAELRVTTEKRYEPSAAEARILSESERPKRGAAARAVRAAAAAAASP